MSELRLFRRLDALRPSELRSLPSQDEVNEALAPPPPPPKPGLSLMRDEFVPPVQATVKLDLTGQGRPQDVAIYLNGSGLSTR
jgi:hypothetical protein